MITGKRKLQLAIGALLSAQPMVHALAASPVWSCHATPENTWSCTQKKGSIAQPIAQKTASNPKPRIVTKPKPIVTAKAELKPKPKPHPKPKPAVQNTPYALTRKEIAKKLGWVSDDKANICRGYYEEPVLYHKISDVAPADKSPVTVTADHTEFSQTERSTFQGNVVIKQPARRINADKAYLNRNNETGKLESVDAYGNVYIREPGKLLVGEHGHIDLTNKSGNLDNVIYRMSFREIPEQITKEQEHSGKIRLNEMTAWGRASRLARDDKGVFVFDKASYSTCPPPQHFWTVYAKELTLNRDTGRGTAKGAKLYVKNMPVLYAPYFNFPIDDRRQTGFLYPSFGHSSDDGYDLAIPFYWNIAPNYDATITPDIMTSRGVQLNGEFRYLTSNSYGNIHGTILPDDREFESFRKDTLAEYPVGTPSRSRLDDDDNNRYFLSIRDNTQLNENWSTYLYINRASDDYYFDDFESDPSQVTDNQIINQGSIYYNSEHWHFTGNVQGYQTLHPVNQPAVSNQYRMLPQLKLDGDYPGLVGKINGELSSEAVYFDQQQNPGSSVDPVTGSRLYLEPGVNIPIYTASGFIIPEMKLSATQYDLKHQTPGQASSIDRVLPILDVDAGLFFDRYFNFGQNHYQQTFEPRLFYLYVPYENQDDIPLFDTGIQPFGIDQLFRTNRFDGIDRIGDANQVSVAFTSRLLSTDSGEEKASATIGQIYYFKHRKVDVDTNDLVIESNTVPLDTPSSPIAAQLLYHVNHDWSLEGNIAWDPNYGETNNGNAALHYMPDPNHIINLGVVYLKGGDLDQEQPIGSSSNDLYQTYVSASWPIYRNLKGVAYWNYNISHGYSQEYLAGLQYDSCCWAVRVVGGREFKYLETTSTGRTRPEFNNKVYVEFALKGLGAASINSASGLLTDDIRGYNDTFGTVNTQQLTNIL